MIIAGYLFHENGGPSLNGISSGLVERLAGIHVPIDLLFADLCHAHEGLVKISDFATASCVVKRDAGHYSVPSSRKLSEHGPGGFLVGRFAEQLSIKDDGGIGADEEAVCEVLRHINCFSPRQLHDIIRGRFIEKRKLIHEAWDNFERHAGRRKKLSPPGRR